MHIWIRTPAAPPRQISLYCTDMRDTFLHYIVRYAFPFCILVCLTGCGDFVGMKDDDTDINGVEKVQIFIPRDKVHWLYNSVTDNIYTPCILEKEKWRGDAVIKVRGDTSRANYKKSFGLKINGRKYMLERGQENGGIYNRIAMRTYQLAGVPACDTESVGLFLNDSYLGCYNFITYYHEDELKGELFKCVFPDSDYMVDDHPIRAKSDKKYPDDGDFSNLEHLIAVLTTTSDADWNKFVNENVEVEEVASYMAAHDFLTVVDTRGANFYINYDGKYRLIPWDNERCLLKNSAGYIICNDNKLIRRLAAVPEVKTAYNRRRQELCTGGGASCLLDQLQDEVAAMFDNLATAMESDPCFATSRQDFMKIKAYVLAYLDKNMGRASQVDKLTLH